jgi:hypothetical protein
MLDMVDYTEEYMDEINQYYNDPNLQQAQTEAQSAGTTAAQYQSAASLLPQKLREAVMAKVDYNRDIIEQQNKKQAEYFAAPSVAREKYQNIWNPFEREKLVTQERTQAYAPYATMTDILAARTGSLSDIINAGTNAFNADVGAKQSAAELARQKYADLLGIAKEKTENAKWGYEQTHTAGSGDGSWGCEDLFYVDEYGNLRMKGTGPTPDTSTSQPTEPKPTVSSQQISNMLKKPNVNWRSPGGQWEFSQAVADWVPVGSTSDDGFIADDLEVGGTSGGSAMFDLDTLGSSLGL